MVNPCIPLNTIRTNGTLKMEQKGEILYITLPLQSKVLSFQNMINDFAADVQITDNITFTDENLQEKIVNNYVEKQIIDSEPPKFINIFYNRIAYDKNFSRVIKNSNAIDIDNKLEVDLRKIFNSEEKILYQIVSAVVHIGNSADCGHYVSVVKKNEKWYICNDSSVKIISNPINELAHGSIFLLERIDK